MIYLIYLIPFIVTSFIGIVKNKNNKLFLSILFFFLILFASLRDEVGTDWPAYFHFYEYTVHNVEVGYAFINNLFSNLGFPFYIFLILINSLSIGLITKSALKLSAFPILSLLIYYSDPYLYFNFSGMRQALAMSFTTFALVYCFGQKRNKYIFFSLILLAMCFHITSIIFALAFFIPKRKLKKKEFIMLGVGMTFFSSLVYFASTFLTGIFATKAEFYLEHQEQAQNVQLLFAIGLLRRLITVVLIVVFGRKYIFQHNLSAYLFNLYIIGFGIYSTTYLISPDIGVRMSIYFTVLEMFLLANLIYFVKRVDVKFFLYFIVILVSIYKLYTYTLIPAYEYQSIL